MAVRGFGLSAGCDPAVFVDAARLAESLGYESVWISGGPGPEALTALAAAAATTTHVLLGIGVVPISAMGPAPLRDLVRSMDLPMDRLVVGVASGTSRSTETVAAAATWLRRTLGCPVYVGALGPKMCAAAGSSADGLILSWTSVEHAGRAAAIAAEAAAALDRLRPPVVAYVRVDMGPGAAQRIDAEYRSYLRIPAYSRHFTASSITAGNSAIAAAGPESVAPALSAWEDAVDILVVRPLKIAEDMASVQRLLEAARPPAQGR